MNSQVKPLVSVIIPSFKMGQFIGEALESVGAQTYPHWEVIVVDDAGPEDGTRGAVEAFAAKHPDHRVEYIRHDKNQGVGAARNTAIQRAKGEFLAFLDPDDLWHSNHLSSGCQKLGTCMNFDVFYSPVEAFVWNFRIRKLWRISQWHVELFPVSLAAENFIQPSTVILRRSCIEKVGGFTTKPDLQHIEDWDLWIRLAQATAAFHFSKKRTTYRRVHPGSAMAQPGSLEKLRLALVKEHLEFFLANQGVLLTRVLGKIQPKQQRPKINLFKYFQLLKYQLNCLFNAKTVKK